LYFYVRDFGVYGYAPVTKVVVITLRFHAPLHGHTLGIKI
jgi:hypothetical protein